MREFKQLTSLYGGGSSGSVKEETGDVKVPGFVGGFEGGFKGGFDTQKYLLETGLQNIFNLYNQKIASLDAKKQKDIEDAYYVRELSKKYLGEYASNLGIGDVSGDLLNIYGNYQQNINAINQNIDDLAFGYETAFQEQKMDYEFKLADVHAKISEEERKGKIDEIKHNLISENYPDGMSRDEYIESEKSTLGDQYWALKAGISDEERMDKIAEINYNLTMENYPDGKSRDEYIESVRSTLGEQLYWSVKTQDGVNASNQGFITNNQKLLDLLGSMDSYATQEEWDEHIDTLLTEGEIDENQSKGLKNQYTIAQHSSFSLDSSFAGGNDISYLNPDLDLAENAKVFRSKNKQHTLAETNNVIYETDKEMYNKLDAHWQGGEGEDPKPFNKPFEYGNSTYVRNSSDGTFTEYVVAKNETQVTGIEEYSKNSESEEIREEYERIHKELKGKTGHVKYRAYEYDKETGNYKLHLGFKATDVGGEKGKFNIGGFDYKITKNYKNNGTGGIADIKKAWKDGDWDKDYNEKHNEVAVVNEIVRLYFGGDKQAASEYIEGSRGWLGGNKIENHNAIVVYMPKENAYYTINDGELWELERIVKE